MTSREDNFLNWLVHGIISKTIDVTPIRNGPRNRDQLLFKPYISQKSQ